MSKKKDNAIDLANSQPKRSYKITSENLEFHNFEIEKVFEGIFENSIILGEKEPFKVFIMIDANSGERKFITASHTIEKTIAQAKTEFETLNGVIFYFEFQGKTLIKGKQFNKFIAGYVMD